MLKKIILAVALMLPVFGAFAQSTVKIGLVDTGALLQALPDTQEAQKKVQETSQKYEAEYARLNEEMKRLFEEYQKLDEKSPAAIRESKTRDLQTFQEKVQAFEQNAQQDLQKMQQELLAPIFQKIKDAVESVGKQGGYSLIQDYNPQMTLYYAAPVEDITPKVKTMLGIK